MFLKPRAHASHALAATALALSLLAAASFFSPTPAATNAHAAAFFTVNSTADGADANLSDGMCNDGAGNCTLRAAIQQANVSFGLDLVRFSIDTGAQTIAPATELPDITDPLIIDGTTQPGFAGTPIVELSGENRQNTTRALLVITAGGSTVRGLVINRSSGFGLALEGNGNSRIEGNYIGTDGVAANQNNAGGIDINSPGNVIGGTTPAARNVISGNLGDGIRMAGSLNAGLNRVLGNYIGISADGNRPIPNSSAGVGGATFRTFISGNVISGNGGDGVRLDTHSGVSGNFIGTDATGTRAIANGGHGIRVTGQFNGIGPITDGPRNVISGNNGFGIFVEGGNSITVSENSIGADASGLPLPNGRGPGGGGIRMSGFDSGISRNLIAYNNGPGIVFDGNGGNSVHRNNIFSNRGLGIDLGGDGLTPNDFMDADSGPNGLQNFPVITAVTTDGATTTVRGAVTSTAARDLIVNFYANGGCDPSGHGEGAQSLGMTTVRTDAGGDAAFLVTVLAALPPGRFLTATASDFSGSTSEFSPCHGAGQTSTFQFGEFPPGAREDMGFIEVPVFRGGGSERTVTVNYATRTDPIPFAASPGVDYVPTSGTLTFAPGEMSKNIVVRLIDDGRFETPLPLVFFVTLTSHDALGSVSQPETPVYIADRGNTALFSAGRATVVEGDAGTRNALITVTRGFLTPQIAGVEFETVGETAVPGVDFQHVSGSLVFDSRTLTRTVSVPIIGDTLDEEDKTFRLRLMNAANGSILENPNQPPSLIADDDPPPAVTVGDEGIADPASGAVSAVFKVSLSAPSANTVTVNFVTADGTATAGSDYQATGGTLSFNPGLTSANIIVMVNGDAADEPIENFFLKLSAPTNATLADALAVFTIGEPGSPVVQFGPSDRTANEGAHFFDITVTRSGDTSGAASVNYSSMDETATERADYTTAVGTVRFAAGETSKTVRVLLTEDAFAEGTEDLRLRLADVVGARIGSRSVAAQNFADSPPPAPGNPIDDARVFVRQHYHDLLGREPDAAGLDFWSGQITACAGEPACVESRRVAVSSAFFLSIEFQNTGYQVIRVYKASFPHTAARPRGLPRYRELLRATREIGEGVVVGVGDWERQLRDNTQAFARRWVTSADFLAEFPSTMSAAEFVDKLFHNAQVAPTPDERDAALAAFGAGGTEGRAAALLNVTGSGSVFNKQFNPAFVLMQYVGYLRRGPDDPPDSNFGGFDFWLTKLNSFSLPGDVRDESAALERVGQAEMIRAFINSIEYRRRFGQ